MEGELYNSAGETEAITRMNFSRRLHWDSTVVLWLERERERVYSMHCHFKPESVMYVSRVCKSSMHVEYCSSQFCTCIGTRDSWLVFVCPLSIVLLVLVKSLFHLLILKCIKNFSKCNSVGLCNTHSVYGRWEILRDYLVDCLSSRTHISQKVLN